MNLQPSNPACDVDARSLTIYGILAGTNISTLDGTLPVEYLSPGDRIVTRSGAARLVALSSQMLRMAEVVLISASTLGYDRPEVDLFLAPEQQVIIRDWRARVMFGVAAAAIPARRLVDGQFVQLRTLAEARFFTLRFDTEEVVYAEGLEIACARATVEA